MKNLFTLITTALIITATAQEADKGIQFKHNAPWNEVLDQAKKENKIIFVDAYTTWCGPCKWMAKNVFTNDTVAEYFNKTFINAKIDMEKGEGLEFAKKYGVRNYPSLIYINGDGEMVHRTCGSVPAQQFINDGKVATDSKRRLSFYKSQFEKEASNATVATTYFILMANACMNYDKELAAYFATQKESELSSATNWNIINQFEENANSKAFVYLTNNREAFIKLYTKDSVENKIVDVYAKSLSAAARKGDEQTYTALISKLRALNNPKAEEIVLQSDLNYFRAKKDWTNYASTAVVYVEKFGKSNPKLLNEVAWNFYEHVDDKAMLEKAAGWSKLSTDQKEIYAFYDTYAAVLYKLGKKEEAAAAAEKAIKLAKANNEDYKETELLLDKIKAIK